MIRYITIILFLALGMGIAKGQETIQGSFVPLLDYRVATVALFMPNADVECQSIDDFIKFKTYEDGRIGSFTNLMGDAFEKAGKELGKYIKKTT